MTSELNQLIEQGNHCLKQNKPQQALLFFNQAILLEPEYIEALINCAKILMELNRAMEAAVYSQRALQLQDTRNTLTLHGEVLYQMGQYFNAINCFERIIAQDPTHVDALWKRALCLTQINRHHEALEEYQKALTFRADNIIHYNYSLCLLAMGKLLPGFKLFEYRWLGPSRAKNQTWKMPESVSVMTLQGKSILIHFEQGLGDSIQFFRYIPLLVGLGARVFVEIQPALIPLFYSWHTTVHFIAIGSPLPNCDYHCPSMSLARLFNTELHTIPKAIPYIVPEPTVFETSQRTLGTSSNKRVGIAWKGNSLHPMNPQRCISLSLLLTLPQNNLDFICLQKDISLEEKNKLDQHKIPYYSLELSTMSGTAALIACLDLVITIDTSIAHLAAAMGKKVWILLPLCSDWRWFLQREDSPWYSNVTLFRQSTLGDWSAPWSCIKNALLSFQSKAFEAPTQHLMQEAELHLQNGRFSQATQLYQTVLVKNPINHSALLGMALAAFQQNNMADAIQFMQQAAEMAPNIALYRRNLGELLRRVGHYELAITSHKIAINIEPHSAENHFLLGLAYNNNQQFELSIQHYRVALSYDQNYGVAWNNLGASFECIGDKKQAKIAYATAIQLNPKHAEAQNNLGAIYSEEGLLDEARTHFEAAVEVNPDFIDAHYNLSLIKIYVPNDPHLASIEAMMPKIEHSAISTRIRYYFTLGKALDDIKDYARAFKAYAEGNRLHHASVPWNNKKLHELVKHTPNIFTTSFLKKEFKTKETRCPIFIVGMPRAGTTLIEQILSSHEHIYGAGELSILDEVIQEACYASNLPFHLWVMQLSDEEFARLGEQYLERTWKLAPDKQYIIDKMPSNCFYIGMIYRMLPTAKIIHAIRDPMDSCFSCFTHLFKEGMSFAYDLTTLGNYYKLYAETMQHWHSVLPQTALFDLRYEEMVTDYENYSKQLIAYIGLPWDPACLQFYKNKRLVKTASLTQVRQPIYKISIQRWQHFAQELQPLLDIVAPYRNLKRISA